MPTPRQIAEKVNESSLFADGEQGFDAEAGCPTSVAGKRPAPDYAASPVNPPTPPAPCTNMKKR
jgi:hypothetical protein